MSPKSYRGAARRLLVAFDIGTTYSGVAYCLLDPGAEPRICSVTRYPGHEHATGSTKIPTVLCYNRQGALMAAGAEAYLTENMDRAEDEEWVRVDWFKLRLRPKSMPTKLTSTQLAPLPPGKTIVQVFGDFMAYLMGCAEKFVKDTHPAILPVWDNLRRTTEFVIGHPNGWEGSQQTKMRRAAIQGGLVPDTPEGRSRVTFVTEGEASLHYCIKGGVVTDAQKGFVIADLGGGTLDYSAYQVTATKPLRVTEVAAAKCDLEGSTFVTMRAKGHLKHKLRNSPYGREEIIKQIGERFDETTKRTFRGASDACLVQFGSAIDKDIEHGIRAGKLRLSGEEVAGFFEPSVSAAANSVLTLVTETSVPITAVYLVGGFSASPHMINQLSQRLAPYRITVSIPDNQTAKAVAEGAISFYLDHCVSCRVAKLSYGVRGSRSYKPHDPEHARRKHLCFKRPSGHVMVNGAFVAVLEKGTAVSEEKEFRKSFSEEIAKRSSLSSVNFGVVAYRGPGKPPEWEDQVTDPNLLKQLFVVTVDASVFSRILQEKTMPNGTKFWRYEYDLVIWFGGSELKAQAVWKENGVEKRTAAQILYDGAADDDFDDPDDLDDRGYPVGGVARLRI